MDAQVTALVDEVLRPLVEADGGSVELVSIEKRHVVLRLGRACAGCPGVHYTRDKVIQPLFRKELGDDVTVEIVRSARRPK